MALPDGLVDKPALGEQKFNVKQDSNCFYSDVPLPCSHYTHTHTCIVIGPQKAAHFLIEQVNYNTSFNVLQLKVLSYCFKNLMQRNICNTSMLYNFCKCQLVLLFLRLLFIFIYIAIVILSTSQNSNSIVKIYQPSTQSSGVSYNLRNEMLISFTIISFYK